MAKSSSNAITTAGRVFFALGLLGFGILYAISGHLRGGLPLFPAWTANGNIIAYAMAAILIVVSIALLGACRISVVSLVLALLLFVSVFLYFQHTNYVLHDGDGRTLILECLSLAATALVLHGLSIGPNAKLSLMPGRILFAFAMIVFGVQHFMYTRFIATLVPGFIPAHRFMVELTGVALIAAGVAVATTILDKVASWGLFTLFFGWLVLLHAPRVLRGPHSIDEWASLFVVVALSGASLLLVSSCDRT